MMDQPWKSAGDSGKLAPVFWSKGMPFHLLAFMDTHLDPFMIQKFRRARQAGRVANGRIEVGSSHFRFLDLPLPEGACVQVWLNDGLGFCAATEEELTAEQDRLCQQEQQRQSAQESAIEAQNRAALNFRAQYRMPFRWSVGIKDRLGGLSSRSWGDGRSAATVEHLRVLEPFTAPRLTRQAGDFLCTARKGTNGRQWVEPMPGDLLAVVTCPRCLALMARWKHPSG